MPTTAQVDTWLANRPEPRYTACQAPAPQPTFAVTFTKIDGTGGGYIRHGGTATEHAAEAMELAGLGARVTVDSVWPQ